MRPPQPRGQLRVRAAGALQPSNSRTATDISLCTRARSVRPFTQPTIDEYQTWPSTLDRSAKSSGCGSPIALMMIPSISLEIWFWQSIVEGSDDASEEKTASTRRGWRPIALSARSSTSVTRSAWVPPRAGTCARRASSCSTQWTSAAASRWSFEVKYR